MVTEPAIAESFPAPYHHGDLRQALLKATTTILNETGQWDFSLREVARRAGVSHNAPYRHFPDKDALLAAVGESGFEQLQATGAVAIAGLSDPAELLAALGKAYIAFGVANPALYRLMFGQAFPSNRELPSDLLEAINRSRQGLHDVIAAGIQQGTFRSHSSGEAPARALSVAAWAVVHGTTMLLIDQIVQRDHGPDVSDRLPGEIVDLIVAGFTR